MKFFTPFFLLVLSSYVIAEPRPVVVVNLDGTYEELDPQLVYQDKESYIVYGPSDKRYMYAGQQEDVSYDSNGNPTIITVSCATGELWNNPSVLPPWDVKLPSDSCQLQEIPSHFQLEDENQSIPAIYFDWENGSLTEVPIVPAQPKTPVCELFAGGAPPGVLGEPVPTAGHIGPTTYRIKVRPTSEAACVLTRARYWHPLLNRWYDADWRETIHSED